MEAMGLDSGKLESLRVSASNSSPMADTLDLCVRYTDAATLEALLPRLLQLVKSGLGLNTRSANPGGPGVFVVPFPAQSVVICVLGQHRAVCVLAD